MSLEKLPRWVLISGFVGFMTISGAILRGSFADLDQTKERSIKTEQTVSELTKTIEKIEQNQNSFTEKYDRNQEENQRVFRQILAALKS